MNMLALHALRHDKNQLSVELGHEPPLDPLGLSEPKIGRSRINQRWLVASVLTAVSGALLIGSAIHISLENEGNFAEQPLRYVSSDKLDPTSSVSTIRRGDKLIRNEPIITARQTFKASMSVRSANREIIKTREFVRLSANLLQTSGVYATDIPAFNAAKLNSQTNEAEDASEERYAEAAPEVSEAEVAVTKSDMMTTLNALQANMQSQKMMHGLSQDEVVLQIEQERRTQAEAGRRTAVSIPAQQMLSRILRQPEAVVNPYESGTSITAPFSAIELRVIPENVTVLPKIEGAAKDRAIEERVSALKRGETLDVVLRSAGLNSEGTKELVAALGGRAKINALPEGQNVRVTLAPTAQSPNRQVVRVMLVGENGLEALAALNDQGKFVSVNVPAAPVIDNAKAKVKTAQQRTQTSEDDEITDEEDDGTGVRLYESLYETAAKYSLNTSIVEDLMRIFSYDFDFQKRVSSGDALDLFFVQDEDGSSNGEMLYASLIFGGEKRQVYRHVAEDGAIDYFDEAGRSLKKFLMRKPLSDGTFRSGFGYRTHPILRYRKMHTGVDWANRIGTPIFAAGNGTITTAGWEGGYGRRIEIEHANGYVTTYSHMSSFARSMQVGTKVKQGQVIGYVGSTGLSTGPHLHYEVLINGSFVDPMKIRVPRGRELDGRALLEFKRQREQTDLLISKSGAASSEALNGTRGTF